MRRFGHALERAAVWLQRGDHCGKFGVLGYLRRALEIDAADGDQRDPRLLRSRVCLGEQCQPNRRVRALFGRRAEHGPEGHVVGPFGQGCGKLRERVRGDPYQKAGGEQAYQGQRKILLADVHAVALTQDCQIRSIIGYQARTELRAQGPQGPQQLERLACAGVLGPQLKQGWPRRKDALRECQHRVSPKMAGGRGELAQAIDVNDRV